MGSYPCLKENNSMRTLFRSGSLIMTLGIALTGCYQTSKPASQADAGADQPVADAHSSASEYVVKIEGMT